jgi:hypothetical protein
MAVFPEGTDGSRELLEVSSTRLSDNQTELLFTNASILVFVEPEGTDLELLYGKGINKGEKYGNLVAGIDCGFVGSASGLHSA